MVCGVFAMLSLVLPPLTYFSGAAIALVVLRNGLHGGVRVLFGATLAVALIEFLLVQSVYPALVFLLALWLPAVLLAYWLRASTSLAQTLMLAAALGVIPVFAAHLMLDDPAIWWSGVLGEILQGAGTDAPNAQLQGLIETLSRSMTGIVAVAFVLNAAGSLLLARWWQARLYNPGGFQTEFHQLRLGLRFSLLAAGVLLINQLFDGWLALVARELLMLALLLLLFQGLAISHRLVALSGARPGWLVVLYLLLFFSLPQTGITLALAAVLDNWFDFRAMVEQRKKPGSDDGDNGDENG